MSQAIVGRCRASLYGLQAAIVSRVLAHTADRLHYHRKFRLLAGVVLALIGAAALAMYLDPHVWRHYIAMLHAYRVDGEFLPTPACLLRLLIAPGARYIQLLPSDRGHRLGRLVLCAQPKQLGLAQSWNAHDAGHRAGVTVCLDDRRDRAATIAYVCAFQPKQERFSTKIFVALSGIAMLMLIAQVQLLHPGLTSGPPPRGSPGMPPVNQAAIQ